MCRHVMIKINLFLTAVTASRGVKVDVYIRTNLVKNSNKVVLYGSLVLHIKTKLTVHHFELSAYFIHKTILAKFHSCVKCVEGNLLYLCKENYRRNL